MAQLAATRLDRFQDPELSIERAVTDESSMLNFY